MRPIVYILVPDSVSNPWKYNTNWQNWSSAFLIAKKATLQHRAVSKYEIYPQYSSMVGSWLPQPLQPGEVVQVIAINLGWYPVPTKLHAVGREVVWELKRNLPRKKHFKRKWSKLLMCRYFTFSVLPSWSKWQRWWTWIPSFAIRFSGDVPYFQRQSSGGTRRTWFSLSASLRLTIKTVTYLPLTTTRSTGNGSQIPAWKACGTFGRNALGEMAVSS